MQANPNNLSWAAEASELCGLYKYSREMILRVIIIAESKHHGKQYSNWWAESSVKSSLIF